MALSASSGSSVKSQGRSGSVVELREYALLEPLYQVKLLAALRTGDISQIHPFLDDIGREVSHKRKYSMSPEQSHIDGASNKSEVDMAAAALHLAIRCASRETIQILLSHRAISPNTPYPPGSGTTPLHLAASLGRTDIVSLLLEQDGIDDTARDKDGRMCKDVAKGKAVMNVLRDSRQFLTARYRSLLHAYVSSPSQSPSQSASENQLYNLLTSPRAHLLDLNYLDPSSGRALLHEACLRRDLRMIEVCVRAGGDIWLRDGKGRGVFDSVYTGSKSNEKGNERSEKGEKSAGGERVRVFLRQFTNQDPTLLTPIRTSSINGTGSPTTYDIGVDGDELPTLKGYLNKYTNVAKGYNTRWFVLEDGVLSYYRHQEDESIASRGSISMRTAVLKIPSSFSNGPPLSNSPVSPIQSPQAYTYASSTNHPDKLRFEVHSVPSRVGSTSGQQKWYIKGSHTGEVARWIRALGRSIEVCRRRDGIGVGGGVPASQDDIPSMGGLGLGLSSASIGGGGGSGSDMDRRRSSLESDNDKRSMKSVVQKGLKKISTSRSLVSVSGSVAGSSTGLPSVSGKKSPVSSLETGDELDDRMYSRREAEHAGSAIGDFPYHTEREADDEDAGEDNDDDKSDDVLSENTPPHEANFALQSNALTTQVELSSQLFGEYLNSAGSSTLQSSSRSLHSGSNPPSIAPSQTQQALSEALNATRQMLTDFIHMSSDREEWYKKKLDKERERAQVWEESLQMVVKEGDVLERELKKRVRKDRESRLLGARSSSMLRATGSIRRSMIIGSATGISPQSPADISTPTETEIKTPTIVMSPPAVTNMQPPRLTIGDHTIDAGSVEEVEEEVDTDDEDEFFDAIESNTLPNLVVTSVLASSPATDATRPIPPGLDVKQYAGYAKMRTSLPIDEDKRPPTSLWSVLKHSIGKDLTKISFPVFFNEPTSMLQRMAEDMEFSECLDAAVAEADPHKRIAFVAAFAMSNYSSTIGRIAKPFNPMLSETFEYVRLDKQYRYVSEQVSHHPPISACWAEAPSWHYFGEVDAQNKFMGKSFEIRPTGVAHAELAIPEKWGPGYPHATKLMQKGKVIEHYSWKKVTTNVSGFILGSPTTDHYGDMLITNHRTGDQCILTFKPRGWRGKDAYEISGRVMDSAGNATYEIAGRWNSKLVARAIGTGFGNLHPDVNVNPSRPTSPTTDAEFILLWRNTEKPKAPFNLTPFAITLNDCPDTLKSYICPTDCRLRPDQRAFELGKYDRANELKNMQEEYQRATRKAREERKIPPHRPRWFEATTDGDTGERVWEPVRTNDGELEYWSMRKRVWSGGAEWSDIDKIFIDETA